MNVQKTWELFSEPVFGSRFASSLSRSDAKITSLVNQTRGIKLTSLGVMDAYSENAWDNAVLSDGNWRLVEFSDISNFPSVSEITNDDFQYFVTVAGNSRYYLLLGAELQAVESDGNMTNTLVYLSHFGTSQRESSVVTLPIEFDEREDLLNFAESLAYVFGESRKRTLLFRVESLND
ncbi:hypothetical protein [Endozoicomonas ascidiicola]|uniref:hypothetical protein n=1 Tax=Endozoicomonas ascidiicola TaxID=1698521 RepID=UPI0012FCD508|nr:hypothetical protein [Endozoicomonas ascidiicola]